MSDSLENYLNQLRSQLKGLPREQREAEVEEARQHLESLIQQRIEAGDSEAIVNALRQFGSPQANGKALRQAWNREGGNSTLNRFLLVSHLLLGAVLLHCVIAEPLRNYYYHLFGHPKRPVWLLWVTFEQWTFGVYVLLFFYALFAVSFLFPRQLRTIFFGVFAAFVASSISIDTIQVQSYGYFWRGHTLYLIYAWKVALLLLSSFGMSVELVRHKSLFSSALRRAN